MTERSDGGSHTDDDPALEQDTHWHQLAQRHYDPQQGAELTTAIVYTLAEAEDIELIELKSPQLYEVVDVPAIEKALFEVGSNGDSRPGTGTLEFRYSEQLLKIRSDGWIQVYGTNEPSKA